MQYINQSKLVTIIFVLILLTCLLSCSPKTPSPFGNSSLKTITLFPTVDVRKNKKTDDCKLKKDHRIQNEVAIALARKGYKVIVLDSFPVNSTSYKKEAIAKMNVTELAKLGPPNSKYLMFIFLKDTSDQYLVLAAMYEVELSAILIDKSTGRCLWKNKAEGAGVALGAVQALLLPIDNTALEKCVRKMLSTLPNNQ